MWLWATYYATCQTPRCFRHSHTPVTHTRAPENLHNCSSACIHYIAHNPLHINHIPPHLQSEAYDSLDAVRFAYLLSICRICMINKRFYIYKIHFVGGGRFSLTMNVSFGLLCLWPSRPKSARSEHGEHQYQPVPTRLDHCDILSLSRRANYKHQPPRLLTHSHFKSIFFSFSSLAHLSLLQGSDGKRGSSPAYSVSLSFSSSVSVSLFFFFFCLSLSCENWSKTQRWYWRLSVRAHQLSSSQRDVMCFQKHTGLVHIRLNHFLISSFAKIFVWRWLSISCRFISQLHFNIHIRPHTPLYVGHRWSPDKSSCTIYGIEICRLVADVEVSDHASEREKFSLIRMQRCPWQHSPLCLKRSKQDISASFPQWERGRIERDYWSRAQIIHSH